MEAQNTIILKDQEEIDRCLSSMDRLQIFRDIQEWDREAANLLNNLIKEIDELEVQIRSSQSTLEDLEREHQSKSAFQRVFGKGNDYKIASEKFRQQQIAKQKLEELAEKLQEMIDFTPNNPDDHKSLLKELRLQKKELQVEKRELASNVTAIRVKARQQTADKAYIYGFREWNRMTSLERRKIRTQKEMELAPYENKKAIIEKQIIRIDSMIAWLEKIKG